MLRLGALALIVCLHICFAYSAKNTAKLKAKFSSSRSFNTTAIHSFPSWFQSPSTALALLTINPVIESLDNSSLPSGRPHFIANLAPIDILPGVRLLQPVSQYRGYSTKLSYFTTENEPKRCTKCIPREQTNGIDPEYSSFSRYCYR